MMEEKKRCQIIKKTAITLVLIYIYIKTNTLICIGLEHYHTLCT